MFPVCLRTESETLIFHANCISNELFAIICSLFVSLFTVTAYLLYLHLNTKLVGWFYIVECPFYFYFFFFGNVSFEKSPAQFRHLLGANGLWVGRDLYRATSALTRGLEFWSLIQGSPHLVVLFDKQGVQMTYVFPDAREISYRLTHDIKTIQKKTLQVYSCIKLYSIYIFINTFMNITNLRFLIKLTLRKNLIFFRYVFMIKEKKPQSLFSN